MTAGIDGAWPGWLVAWLLLAGCGAKPAVQSPTATTLAAATEAAAPVDATAYDPEWGDACAPSGGPLPFGRARTVEIATCLDDPPPPDGEARPLQHTAYLVVRRDDKITATLKLGTFVVWEEGHEWKLVGAIEAATGAAAALAIYNNSGVGPNSSFYELYAYGLSGDELSEIYQTGAGRLEVTVAGDRRAATVELCSGCDDEGEGERKIEVVELRFDGSKVIDRRVP